MNYFVSKNTNSSTGADFAPSSRSAVNSCVDMYFSGTALAVSVLFLLLLAKGNIIGLVMLSSIITLLTLCVEFIQDRPQ